MNKDIKCGNLNNGMKYAFMKLSQMNSATIMYLINVGSRCEQKGYYGMSHFIEHMLFKGTKNRLTSKNISNALYKHGANFNAFTSHTETGYYVKINYKNVESALDVLSDMLFNSSFNKKDIELEKGVVINENKKNKSEPGRILSENLYKILFKNTSFEHSIGGLDGDIKNFDRNKIFSYMRKYYDPKNIVLIIVGNFDFNYKELLKIINKNFNKQIKYIPKKNLKIKKKIFYDDFLNKQKTFKYINIIKDFPQSYVAIAFPSYSFGTTEYYTCEVIANILGGNMSSRLFTILREEHGLVYSISADNESLNEIGIFEISFGTYSDISRIEKCLKFIFKEISNIKEHSVTSKELSFSINYIVGQMLIGTEDSFEIASYFSNQIILNNKVISYKDYIKNLKKVTKNDILKVANIIFNKNKCNIGIVSKNKISKKRINSLIIL